MSGQQSSLKLDMWNMFREAIGPEHGVDAAEVDGLGERADRNRL